MSPDSAVMVEVGSWKYGSRDDRSRVSRSQYSTSDPPTSVMLSESLLKFVEEVDQRTDGLTRLSAATDVQLG